MSIYRILPRPVIMTVSEVVLCVREDFGDTYLLVCGVPPCLQAFHREVAAKEEGAGEETGRQADHGDLDTRHKSVNVIVWPRLTHDKNETYNSPILISPLKLTINSLAQDGFLEPSKGFGRVWLCWSTEMSCLHRDRGSEE